MVLRKREEMEVVGELPPLRRVKHKLEMSREVRLLTEGFNNFATTVAEAPVTGHLIGKRKFDPSKDTDFHWLCEFVKA